MDTFAKYDNTLGFFVGNEIIALNNQSNVSPFIKASARDMKAYRDAKGYRKFPIGYSAADIAELRPMLQDYLTCGGNSSEIIDFFALNSYEWCGNTNFKESGYVNLQNMAKDFPVPIFFSETGCITAPPRLFQDQAAIFGPEMVNDWSGSLVYEWIQEANQYGLIQYGPPVDVTVVASNVKGGFTRAGTPTPIQPDFDNLKSQWATLSPTGVALSAYDTKAVSTRACPASTAGGWLVNGNVRLPSLGETFKGSFTPTQTAENGSPTPTKNPGSLDKEITGMSAGLIGLGLVFTLWL
jgi:1,3-beta-glucanosyltransferase GAS1